MEKRILCLDDEPLILKMEKRVLSPIALVDTAETVDKALALVRENPQDYGLIITDYQIPSSREGLTFLKEIQPLYAQEPNAPQRWLYTGTPDDRLETQVAEFGGVGVVNKLDGIARLREIALAALAKYSTEGRQK